MRNDRMHVTVEEVQRYSMCIKGGTALPTTAMELTVGLRDVPVRSFLEQHASLRRRVRVPFVVCSQGRPLCNVCCISHSTAHACRCLRKPRQL